MGRIEITETELLEALRQAVVPSLDRPPQTYTTQEMCEALGWHERKVRTMVRTMIAAGRCEPLNIRIPSIRPGATPMPSVGYHFIDRL